MNHGVAVEMPYSDFELGNWGGYLEAAVGAGWNCEAIETNGAVIVSDHVEEIIKAS